LNRIPGNEEWAGYENEPEGPHAHELWFGKSLDEMQPLFSDSISIERGEELVFMPRRAFQFYIFAFVQYVMSDAAIGNSDAASVFLGDLIARETRDPGSVAQIYPRLESAIEFVAASQARFDASHDIYGDFAEKAVALKKLLGIAHSPQDPQDQYLDPTDDA
jgi:hypothetical protein